ncbi:MAG: type II secretion system F family protein [Pseudomonadota bacterium]
MDQQVILVILLGVVCFAALGFVLLAPTEKDKARQRVSSIDTGRASQRRGGNAAAAQQADQAQKQRRRKLNEALSKLDDQQKELKKKKRVSLAQRLEQAGLPATPKQFYVASLIVALLFGLLGLATAQKPIITIGLFFIGGVGAPNWFVSFNKKRRQKKFADEFSNAIDVIVRGVKSGLPVNECLKIISIEAPKPVNEEFHMLTEGVRIGLSMEQSLERMYERMPLQEVNFFAIVLTIQAKTGGNLAEALNNLATVLRQRKQMVGKVQALSAEAKASAMIIGALPFLVMGAVKLSAPDYLTPLFVTRVGNFILIGAGMWMSLGIFVMKKMMAIKV